MVGERVKVASSGVMVEKHWGKKVPDEETAT